MPIDFLATKGPLVPSNSTICPLNGPKRREKAPKYAQCALAPRNQALPKLRILCPKPAFFGPKQSRNPLKTDKRREMARTLHVRLNCPLTKSPLLPSKSATCPKNGPKMAKNGLNVRYLCQTSPTSRTGRILGYVAQIRNRRAPSPPATPHLLWFPSLGIAQPDA